MREEGTTRRSQRNGRTEKFLYIKKGIKWNEVGRIRKFEHELSDEHAHLEEELGKVYDNDDRWDNLYISGSDNVKRWKDRPINSQNSYESHENLLCFEQYHLWKNRSKRK